MSFQIKSRQISLVVDGMLIFNNQPKTPFLLDITHLEYFCIKSKEGSRDSYIAHQSSTFVSTANYRLIGPWQFCLYQKVSNITMKCKYVDVETGGQYLEQSLASFLRLSLGQVDAYTVFIFRWPFLPIIFLKLKIPEYVYIIISCSSFSGIERITI